MPQSIPDLPRKAAAGEITGTAGSSDRRGITRLGPDWSSGYAPVAADRARPSTLPVAPPPLSVIRVGSGQPQVLETQFEVPQ